MTNGLARQIPRFLVVGVLTVLVDYAVYFILLSLDVPIPLAKAISFIAGAVFAYFANMRYTFQASGSYVAFASFWGVYLVNLVVNVSVNSGVIALIGDRPAVELTAFLVATGVSATLNFIGMKFLVFR